MAEKTKKYRIVFMGTPDFAARILGHINSWSQGRVVGVYTQPDRPSKRGQKTVPQAVKATALELGLPVFQPAKLRDEAVVRMLAALEPDFLLVAAYGMLIPRTILDLPTYPPINVHGSLLPLYRGAAPIQRAILEQAEITGVSIMQMVEALDAGPVYLSQEVPILEKTSDDLFLELSELGADLLLKVLTAVVEGTISPLPQDENRATYAAKLSKEDGLIDFQCTARAVHARVRAVTSRPGAQVTFAFQGLQPIKMTILPGRIEESCSIEPGTIERDKEGLRIATKDFWYRLTDVKPQGKAFMPIKAFLNGRVVPQGICGHVTSESPHGA